MIDNTITLAVDTANTSSTTDELYTRFEESSNRSVYTGPTHDLSGLRDMLTITRALPKKNGNFRGTGKSSTKFTKDHEVEGVDTTTTLNVPGIIEVSTSFPLGMLGSERIHMRQKAIALLDSDNLIDRIQGQLEY